MTAAPSNVVQLFDDAGEDIARVPPGDYDAFYQRHVGALVFGSPKLRVDMQLVAYPEISLSRWYRVQDFRGGRIRASRHSDLVREISVVIGKRVRADRVPVSELKGLLVRVDVRTVTRDSQQRALAEVNQYSSIERLIRGEKP